MAGPTFNQAFSAIRRRDSLFHPDRRGYIGRTILEAYGTCTGDYSANIGCVGPLLPRMAPRDAETSRMHAAELTSLSTLLTAARQIIDNGQQAKRLLPQEAQNATPFSKPNPPPPTVAQALSVDFAGRLIIEMWEGEQFEWAVELPAGSSAAEEREFSVGCIDRVQRTLSRRIEQLKKRASTR